MRPRSHLLPLAWFIAAGALAPAIAHAQTGTVTGLVTDAATGHPLEGATIEVHGTPLAAESRGNGRYVILAVPPGEYTIAARRIGYGAREVTGVAVRVDQTTTLSFALDSARTLTTVRVEAAPPPLIDPRAVSAQVALTGEQIMAFPAATITDVLMLSPGFAVLGATAGLRSLAADRRGEPSQISVRGGRAGSTVQIIDGIAVNNPVFGAPAIELNPLALASLTFSPGYMEAQYGGGIAGIINTALREGSEVLRAALDYQTSTLPGAMGSPPDAAARAHSVRGFVSGPLGDDRLRLALTGQVRTTRERVVQFPTTLQPASSPFVRPALNYTGWHGFGAEDDDQFSGKLTFAPVPSLKLSLTGIGQTRRVLAYDRRFLGTYRDVALPPTPGPGGTQAETVNPYSTLVQGSVRQSTEFVNARAEQRFARAAVTVAHGAITGNRLTCNVFQGVCLEDAFWRAPRLANGTFLPEVYPGMPVSGTAFHFGGEAYTSRFTRGDVVVQAADNLRLQAGVQETRHRLRFREIAGLPGPLGFVPTATNLYRANPVERAAYAQASVEFDFLVAVAGVRVDHGSAKGIGFANPLNATNRTTAREVCDGAVPGINTTPFTYESATGWLACLVSPAPPDGRPVLLDSAVRLAQADDFRAARPHRAVSPRVGVSFPLTDRGALFLNAGQYTKHPYYHDAYRNTGVGTRAGVGAGTDDLCTARDAKPGTNECPPTLLFHPDLGEHVGNPTIANESASTFELGFTWLFAGDHAAGVTAYSTDHGALTGLAVSERIEDWGLTYTSETDVFYSTIINTDHVTSRGLSFSLRRRLTGHVGYTVNYTWSRTLEVGEPAELASERQERDSLGLAPPRDERVSARDRPHALNVALFLRTRDDAPALGGRIGRALLQNSRLAVTWSWSSGADRSLGPGQTDPGGGAAVGLLANSPSNPVNVMYTKDFAVRNTRYGVFVRATNIFNSQACCGGLYTLEERRRVASGLAVAAPDDRIQLRRVTMGVNALY